MLLFADKSAKNIILNAEYYQYVVVMKKPPRIGFFYNE
jgi:hypothetical protein